MCFFDLPVPPGWDGISFKEQVEGKAGGGREVLVWDHGLYSAQRAIRTGPHLMIRTYDDFGYGFEPIQLYDMEQDPCQTKNLAGERPELVNGYDCLMTEWVQEQRSKDGWRPDPLLAVLQERASKEY